MGFLAVSRAHSLYGVSFAAVHELSWAPWRGDPPGPGAKPESPALAGIFLTTGPQGKSQLSLTGQMRRPETETRFLAEMFNPNLGVSYDESRIFYLAS